MLAAWLTSQDNALADCATSTPSGTTTVTCSGSFATVGSGAGSTNTNGNNPDTTARTQEFADPVIGIINSGTSITTNGLQFLMDGSNDPLTVTNSGSVSSSGNGTLVLSGDGGLITYSGNGSATNTNSASAQAALKLSNTGSGGVNVGTSSTPIVPNYTGNSAFAINSTVDGNQNVFFNGGTLTTTLSSTNDIVLIATGAGNINLTTTGNTTLTKSAGATSIAGINAQANTGSVIITTDANMGATGSGNGLGDGITATSSSGNVSVTQTGGSIFVSDTGISAQGTAVTVNSAGNITATNDGISVLGTTTTSVTTSGTVTSNSKAAVHFLVGSTTMTLNNSGTLSGNFGVASDVAGLSLTNSGTITTSGTGTTAISFTGSGNTLTLTPTSSITGSVTDLTSGASNTLVLDGTGTGSFNLNNVGSTQQYADFGTFIKSNTSLWNLTGSGSMGWTINGGTLEISGTLGAGTTTALNSGTLEIGNNNGLGTGSTLSMAAGTTLTFVPGSNFTVANNIAISGDPNFMPPSGTIQTISGVISDGTSSGTLTMQGPGTLVLTGANTYSGGTTISAGTLQIGNGGTTGSIIGNVIDNGTLVFNRFDNVTFAGAISGSGALQQNSNGSSFLILTGNNSYTGGTVVSQGVLQVGNGGATGSITGNVTVTGTIPGELAFDRSDNVTFSGLISGTGSVAQTGSGILTLPNANAYSGGTFILGGTLAVGNSASLGTGPVGMVDGAILQFTQSGINLPNSISLGVLAGTIDTGANTDTLSGVISGPQDLTKIGTGTLILTNTETYTGPTNVNVGTLEVDGSIATSSLTTVASGAILTGKGTVGSIQINSGATFAPGTAGTPGTSSTVSGNLAFQSGAIYMVQVNPTSTTSANVTGTASLAGSAAATFASGTYMAKQYTILQSGGLNGTTFSALTTTDLPTGFTASLGYTSNNVLLDLNAFLSTAGLNVNQTNVATSLNNFFNSGGTLTPSFASVFGLTGSGLATALSQLDGEVATDAERSAFQLTDQFLLLMLDPFVDGRSGTGWPAAGGMANSFAPDEQASLPPDIALAYASVLKAPPKPAFDQRWSVWGTGFGGSSTTNGDPVIGTTNVTVNDYGFAGGMDYHFSPDAVGGFALAGSGTNWNLAQGLGSGRSDSFQAGLYGAMRSGPTYLSAALAFANHWMSTNRISIAGDQLNASFDAQSYSGRIEAGYRYAMLPAIGVTPYAALQAQSFHTPSYAETDVTGGGFGLNYSAMSASDTRSELGSRFDDMTLFNGMPLALRGRIAWAHDWVNNPSLSAAFQALPGASFVVNGAPVPKDSALASAGAELHINVNWSLAAKFEGEFAGGSQTYAGTGTLRYTW